MSRASPSASSSGVTSVLSTTKPPAGNTATAEDAAAEPPAASATTVSSEYSCGSSSRPPAVTTPASLTDQSPDLEPLMACWTFLPRRGPAARALTTSFCSMPNSSGEALSASSRRTERRFSSSATTAAKPPSASAPGATTVSSCSGRRTRRFAALRSEEPVEQICWTRSIASTRTGLAGNSSASGQSARCTERPPVRPRQISSETSGNSEAETRQTASSAVYSASKASAFSSKKRWRLRRTYQLVSMSR